VAGLLIDQDLEGEHQRCHGSQEARHLQQGRADHQLLPEDRDGPKHWDRGLAGPLAGQVSVDRGQAEEPEQPGDRDADQQGLQPNPPSHASHQATMGDARRDHGVGWLALGGAGDTNRFGWAELASKPYPDQGEGGEDRPGDQDQQPRASQRADIAPGLAGHKHHQQQRQHKTQLAGGQHQRLTEEGSPGCPGFR
jgi:hypothetical protein